MVLLHICSGVILVLLGMYYLRRGLDRLFGNRLTPWLQQVVKNRTKAFFAGMLIGAATPSSTAVAVLSIQMLNRSASMAAQQMFAVLLGANVGITISVQLLAFQLQDFAGIFLVLGGVGFLFGRKSFLKGAGQVLLGLGLIFLAMNIIAKSGEAVGKNEDIKVVFEILSQYPGVILVLLMLLTVVLQSSTAAIGLGIGLTQGGLLSLDAMIPWVLGANLGTAITVVMAGWGTLEGRRLGIGNFISKAGLTAVILIFLPSVTDFCIKHLPGNLNQQIANFNTLFNLALGLAILPWLPNYGRMIRALIEKPEAELEKEIGPDTYLDNALLSTPSLALNQASREELRVLDELKLLLKSVWMQFQEQRIIRSAMVKAYYQKMSQMSESIRLYLGQIGDESLTEKDISWKLMLLDYLQEFDTMNRLIWRDMVDVMNRIVKERIHFSAVETVELENLYQQTSTRIEKATSILMVRNPQLAEEFIREKEKINELCRRWQKIEQLTQAQAEEPVKVNIYFLDLLLCLRRLNSHLTAIGYSLARPPDGVVDSRYADQQDVET